MHKHRTECKRPYFYASYMASRCVPEIRYKLKFPLIKAQGNDNTFGGFPEHLRTLVSHALPKISVNAVTYPTFETRGDLHDCVTRFREWYSDPDSSRQSIA